MRLVAKLWSIDDPVAFPFGPQISSFLVLPSVLLGNSDVFVNPNGPQLFLGAPNLPNLRSRLLSVSSPVLGPKLKTLVCVVSLS